MMARRIMMSDWKRLTLNDGEENNDDEQEEGVIEDHAPILERISVRRVQLVTDATASAHARVQVELK